jgi:hypothetical protein
VTQQVFSTEQVYFLPTRMSLKAGGFLATSQKMPTEWLAYGSVRVPLTRRWAIEPYYFYARVENAPGPENRFMLNNQLRNPKGYELNIGLQWGKASIVNDAGSSNIWGSYATALLPFSQTVWGQLSLRWERAPFDELMGATAGVKIRLER